MMDRAKSVYTQLGARNFALTERETDDFYATSPEAVSQLLSKEKFAPRIWEPACGKGHIAEVLRSAGYEVLATDLIDRGYGIPRRDFLLEVTPFDGDIITNPPYKLATEFALHGLKLVKNGARLAMLLKIQFLESAERLALFRVYPPEKIYVFSKRIICAKNADFASYKSSALCYAWFIWHKGNKNLPVVDWL